MNELEGICCDVVDPGIPLERALYRNVMNRNTQNIVIMIG